jgi:imidazoleglycerol phosphate dehydratase HisB
MKINITPEALKSDNPQLLWSGALSGLRLLQDHNYTLACSVSELSDSQKLLLSNEGISFSDLSGEEADGFVDAEKDELILKSGEQIISTATEWNTLARSILFPKRSAEKVRKTKETDISIRANIDGSGVSEISTGLRFFDHMLEQIARHGLIDLNISCNGDLDIDEHHTIEDVAITLGEVLFEASSINKMGIQRYGFVLVMDETEATVALDLSNRPYLVWNAEFSREYVGDFPLEMAKHFFHTLAMNLNATLHIRVEGENDHHKLEAIFKGFAKAFRFSVSRNERIKDIFPSTKGLL